MKKLTPLEFYKIKFPKDFALIEELQNTGFFSLTAMMQFVELYQAYLNEEL